MRLKLIFSIVGFMEIICGISMMIPAFTDYLYGFTDAGNRFAISSAMGVALGFLIYLLSGRSNEPLRNKEMFLTTTLIWISYSVLSALPFFVSKYNFSWTDSIFEAVSGLTTTGATIMTGLDTMTPGILLWRSILQWVGGAGILVVAILVLPILRIGGMQFFTTESSSKSDRDLPTVIQNMRALLLYYIGLTVVCTLLLFLCGMSVFDAVNYSLTTISTGGFAPHDLSVGYYHNSTIEWIISFFMLVSSFPLVLGLYLLARKWKAIKEDSQIFFYLKFLFFSILLLTVLRWLNDRFSPTELNTYVRESVFAVISVVTTTGFMTSNYQNWGDFALAFFMFLLLMGGCTGSTSGGIKMFRFTVLFRAIGIRLKGLVQPHGVFVPRYGSHVITDDVLISVLVFFGLYFGTSIFVTLAVSACGLDFVTSFSAALTALSNVGPGLGSIINPSSTFATLPDMAKWILSFAMLIGRLEFIAVFVLFFPFLWRRNA